MSAKNCAEIYVKCLHKYLFAEWTEQDKIIYESLRI
jgi:hypothetical protein